MHFLVEKQNACNSRLVRPTAPTPWEAGESTRSTNCSGNLNNSSYCYKAFTIIMSCPRLPIHYRFKPPQTSYIVVPPLGPPLTDLELSLLRLPFHGYKVLPSDFCKGPFLAVPSVLSPVYSASSLFCPRTRLTQSILCYQLDQRLGSRRKQARGFLQSLSSSVIVSCFFLSLSGAKCIPFPVCTAPQKLPLVV